MRTSRIQASKRRRGLAVQSLRKLGVKFSNESRTAQYFHANCVFQAHAFTIDLVLDDNLFEIGKFEHLDDGVTIGSLETLLRMKVATLVSRASEKDLCDIKWLFGHFEPMGVGEWIALGQSIDRGVNPENLLASLAGTKLRKEACGFSLNPKESADEILKKLRVFQKHLIKEIADYLKNSPTPPLGKLLRKIK
jgi:hypothetical protein